jgi:type IV pilus assembly protein PilB
MFISEEKLEKILVEPGYIVKADFDIVKKLAAEEKIPLDRMLVEKGLINDEVIGKVIAEATGYPFISLKKANIEEITPEMLNYIPELVAFAQEAIVFGKEEDTLKVVTANPSNYSFFNILEKKTGKKIKIFYGTPFNIEQALKRYKGDVRTEASKLIEELKQDPKKSEGNIVKLVDLILEYSYINLASDIHIEPLAKSVIIRYRIDGILHKVIEYPKEFHIRIVSRIKILARLRIDERVAPQDGGFEYNIRGARIDFRVSAMPTTQGENVVMRLLMQRGRRFEITELGLLESDLKKLKADIEKPYGMIIAVGPTGSGKTTTLYAMLQMINKPEINIMTIEDPVEYNIERVRQIQVNKAKGITFARGLRSIVRQDPDVIMVGEMRDKETIDMAINSALTGHLVLSTMHANDAPTAFSRFSEMGAKSYLVSSSVNTIIAQRLVQTICKDCKKGYFLSEAELVVLDEEPLLAKYIKEISGKDNLSKVRFYKGAGCKFCDNTGHEDRTAIFEVLELTEEVRSLVTSEASMDAIRKKAIEQGMTTMVYDGITKALMGITTLEEVRRSAKM